MFGKYFKHEFKNSCTVPLIISGVILALALLIFIGSLLGNYSILLGSSTFLALGILVAYASAFVCVAKSFKNRLFSHSGYLTLTLPVSTHTVLLAKILVNIIYVLIYTVCISIAAITLVYGLATCIASGAAPVILEAYIEAIKMYLSAPGYLALAALDAFTYLLTALTGLLFVMSLKNMGSMKKSTLITALLVIATITVVTSITEIPIIPYNFYYNFTDKAYVVISSNAKVLESYEQYYLDTYGIYVQLTDGVSFSAIFWNVVLTIVFYFTSHYMVSNKLDLE